MGSAQGTRMSGTRSKNVLHKEQESKMVGRGKEGGRDRIVAMPESFILFFWLIFPFFLVEKASAMYEGGVTADVAALSSRTHLSPIHLSRELQQD
jgi:hypothetical protein